MIIEIVVFWKGRLSGLSESVLGGAAAAWDDSSDPPLRDAGLQASHFSRTRVLQFIFVHRDRFRIFTSVLGFFHGSLHGRLNWGVNRGHQLSLVGELVIGLSQKSASSRIESRVRVGIDEKARDGL